MEVEEDVYTAKDIRFIAKWNGQENLQYICVLLRAFLLKLFFVCFVINDKLESGLSVSKVIVFNCLALIIMFD